MKGFFYVQHFVLWEIFWGCFASLLGFLFVLSKSNLPSSEAVTLIFVVYLVVVFLIISILLSNSGLLRLLGLKIESRGKYLINKYVANYNYIDKSISDKDLTAMHDFLIFSPITVVRRNIYFGTCLIFIIIVGTYLNGASGYNLFIMVVGCLLAVFIYCFLRSLLNESLSAPILRKCKEMMYWRGIKIDRKRNNLSTLKNRFLYFVFLFFVLMVVAISGVDSINITLLAFTALAFIIILIISRILFLSIYSMFTEIDQFAKELPSSEKATYLTGSSYKEAIELSKKLNKSAERLYLVRKRREEEKDRVKAIINNFDGPIIFIDQVGEVGLFNKAAEDILGIREDDYGKKISDKNNFSLANFKKVIHKKYKIEEADENQKKKEDEVVNLAYFKKEITYKVKTASVYDEENNYYGIVKVFYDLTTEKAIDRAKSKFISIAAHQLRTPLSSIKWIVKMALDGDIGEFNQEQVDLLDKANTSNQRIIRLINDLLNVSKIEEGKFGYKIKNQDMGEILEGILGEFNYKIKRKDIDFHFIKPDKKLFVYVDKEKINLALENVIDNAIKYTPEKGDVTVEAKKGKDSVIIKVKDSGYGIPKKEQEKLFTKFFRASNISGTNIGGSGLGLFITKNILVGHGGDIKLKSQKNKGTEVIMSVPSG